MFLKVNHFWQNTTTANTGRSGGIKRAGMCDINYIELRPKGPFISREWIYMASTPKNKDSHVIQWSLLHDCKRIYSQSHVVQQLSVHDRSSKKGSGYVVS